MTEAGNLNQFGNMQLRTNRNNKKSLTFNGVDQFLAAAHQGDRVSLTLIFVTWGSRFPSQFASFISVMMNCTSTPAVVRTLTAWDLISAMSTSSSSSLRALAAENGAWSSATLKQTFSTPTSSPGVYSMVWCFMLMG